MKGIFYTLFLSIVLLVTSCAKSGEKTDTIEVEEKEVPQEERELKALYDEVINIHDEVMPKMDDIMKAKGALQEQLDTLRDNNPENSAIQELEQTILSLAQADEAMMDWMRNFKPQEDSSDHKLVIEYYKEEKNKITAVKEQMLSALEKANRLASTEEE
ncbi:MAG: hypothetical protein AAGG59_04690 [Bacteroidota bacterium]